MKESFKHYVYTTNRLYVAEQFKVQPKSNLVILKNVHVYDVFGYDEMAFYEKIEINSDKIESKTKEKRTETVTVCFKEEN